MKKQSNLSRLLEIAGSHKYLTYSFLGAFCHQCPDRSGTILLHLENDQGSIGGGTEFWPGTEPDR